MGLTGRRVVKGLVALGIMLACAVMAVEFAWLTPSLPLISPAEMAEQARQRERLALVEESAKENRRAVMEIADRLREELAAREARRTLPSD